MDKSKRAGRFREWLQEDPSGTVADFLEAWDDWFASRSTPSDPALLESELAFREGLRHMAERVRQHKFFQ